MRAREALVMGTVWIVGAGCGWNGVGERAAVSLSPAPPPVRGATLAMSDDGATILVVDRDRARVDRVAYGDGHLTRTASLEFPPTSRPERAVLVGDDAWVVRADGRLAVLDPQLHVDAELDVCSSPYGLAWDPELERAWVSCTTGDVVVVARSRDALEVVARVQLPADTGDLALSGGRVLVARTRAAEVVILDAATGAITARARLPESAIDHPDGRRVDVAHGALRVVPDATGALVLHQRARRGPPQRRVGSYAGERGGPCGGMPVTVAVTHIGSDGSIGRSTTLVGVAYASDLGIRLSDGAIAIASPSSFVDGDDRGAQTGAPVRDHDCTLMRAAPVAGQVTAVTWTPDGTPVWQTREPSALLVGTARLALDDRSARDTGHDIFHVGSESRTPCIACHFDGGDDGHVWEGVPGEPRRTTSLRLRTVDGGGLTSTAPFHRDGSLVDLDALLAVHFPGPGGSTLRRDQIDAFAAWADALAARPSPSVAPDAREAGRAAFERLGCAGCHDPAAVPSARADGLQVPSLLEIGERAPYGHAGCGDRLESMLTARCGGPEHEVTDPADVRALEAYLGVRPTAL